MKLLSSFLFGSSFASHFRGATWLTQVNDDGDLELVFPQTWRRGQAGFSGACSESEQLNGAWSSSFGAIQCTYLDGGSCGSTDMQYQITFADGDNSSGYCYGFGSAVFSPAPTDPFEIKWTGTAWVNFQADSGSVVTGGDWTIRGQYNEVQNSTPQFKLPPIWLIMSTCDGQFIDLNPTDPDGDRMKCRWATSLEGDTGFYRSTLWPSLSLDEENCIVHYTGTLDTAGSGLKPIALMIEDFDANGNVKSSTPIQFLAQVWTPSITVPPEGTAMGHSRSQKIIMSNDCGEECYPIIPHDDHDDHDDFEGRKRREAMEILTRNTRSTVAPYCDPANWPQCSGDVPQDGDELDASTGFVHLVLKASSRVSTISKFVYQGPLGFRCAALDENGESHCNWKLTPEQREVPEHQFCFQAVDHAGLQSERRCITYTTAEKFFINIEQMGGAILKGEEGTFRYREAENYGCAGRGLFNPFSRTIGKQVDEADRDIFKWKKCVQCANGFNSLPEYKFWVVNATCTGESEEAVAVCECDRRVISDLAVSIPNSGSLNYPASQCQKAVVPTHGECCKHSGLYDMINPMVFCCGKNGPQEVGTC